jgi:hypothetical protein
LSNLLECLRPKERRGSKPRCHLFTHGSSIDCAARLTAMAAPFARVSASDRWMPRGFDEVEEAQLHKAAGLLEPGIRAELAAWWLAPRSRRAMTPNFDIASTCMIDDLPGLLLVEAKAHNEELNKEALGRSLTANASDDRRASHETIAAAIRSACSGLSEATSLPWRISRDSHYQMSNRFAWTWKLTALGVPVVLIYLGFLKANEMADRGQPFAQPSDWERLVMSHSQCLFPAEVWNRRWTLHEVPFIPLIRSVEQPITEEAVA